MADKKAVNPAVDEDKTEKRVRTGQGTKPSRVKDFADERAEAAKHIDRSGSPAVPYGARAAATQEARQEAAGETKSTEARAKVAGEDVGPVASQEVIDPTAVGFPYVEPPVRPGFIPEGLDEDDIRQGVASVKEKKAREKAAKAAE